MIGSNSTDWTTELQNLLQGSARTAGLRAYDEANTSAIRSALAGFGPDDGPASTRGSSAGAAMVANISSAHVPAVCEASRNGEQRPYKNGYDLGKYRVGDDATGRAKKLRETVDEALPLPTGESARDVYFGAMELNGTGVYFYGDVCLVLDELPMETVMLDRNSYDLVRAPLRDSIEAAPSQHWPARRKVEALRISGTWSPSRDWIAALKVFEALGRRNRRFTTGEISDALRADEDYVEILKLGSFGTNELAEARLSAADAALEASIEERRRSGPQPTPEAELWGERRRMAERALRTNGVSVRVVTTSGRMKG